MDMDSESGVDVFTQSHHNVKLMCGQIHDSQILTARQLIPCPSMRHMVALDGEGSEFSLISV